MSGAVGFRSATPADREAISSLRQSLFGNVDPEKRSLAYADWAFRDAYAGESFAFVAEAGGRVVGHLGFIAQRYETASGDANGALAVDAMVHEDFRRQHVFSRLARFAAERLRKDVAFSLALQIRQASLGGMLAAGWSVIERIPVRMKVLPFTGMIQRVSRPSTVRHADVVASSHVRLLHPHDLSEISAALRHSNSQPRSAAFVDWRFAWRPGTHYSLHGWYEQDELRAFVVHRRATLKGVRALAIVDAGARAGGEAELDLLLRDVCRYHGDGAFLAAALVSEAHPVRDAFGKSSFHRSPYRFNLLVQVFDRRFDPAATAPWQLTWADTDHL